MGLILFSYLSVSSSQPGGIILQVDSLSNDVQDLQRQVTALSQRLATSLSLVDALSTENNKRSSQSLKIDNWIKEQDLWRDEIDRTLTLLKKDMLSVSYERSEQREKANNYLTK